MEAILQFPHLPPAQQQAILDGPAQMPPKGVVPNLVDPPNRNASAIAAAVVCMTLVIAAVTLRLYTRLFILRRFKVEDYLGLLSFVLYCGTFVCFFLHMHYGGFYVHQWNVSFGNFQSVIMTIEAFSVLYAAQMLCIKSAILLEWSRIFVPRGAHNAFFWSTRVMLVCNICFYGAGFVADLVACLPLAKMWSPWIPGQCANKKLLDILTAYFNLVVDVILILLPQRVIWKLQMSRGKKAGVSVVFSIGLLTIACAIGRVIANHKVQYQGGGDTLYDAGPIYLWAFSEFTCVLLVFNIPAAPKFFTDSMLGSRIMDSLRSWAQMGSAKSSVVSKVTGSASNSSVKGRKAYHTMDVTSETELTDIKSLNSSEKTAGPYEVAHVEGGGIMRRIDIEAHESIVSVDRAAPVTHPQHMWKRQA